MRSVKQFIEIFNKVGGKEVLKQYRRAHVLAFAITEILIIGFSKKSLEIVRLAVNNRIYERLKKKNKAFIEEYKKKHYEENTSQRHTPIVWTIWLQGMESAPEIVKKCYESMVENIEDREIIVITENNYKKYVNFPDFILEKYKRGIISKVHFADLLRIELLANYGGTWLDGTVFCSGTPFQNYFLDSELFLFQNLKPGLDGQCRAISSWLMTAWAGNSIILLTRALLHNYWSKYDYAVDYFILHDFMQMAIEAYPEVWNKVMPFSNSMPHILLLRMFEKYDEKVWSSLKMVTPFHKMTYKFKDEQTKLEGTYYDVIFKES